MRVVVGTMLCAIGLTACGGSSSMSANGSNPTGSGGGGIAANVTIANTAYSPASITITAGGSVKWTNTDGVTHSVTADAGGFAKDLMGTMPDNYGGMTGGGTFTQTFPSAGTFAYHCTYHSSMHGTVTVNP